MDCLQCCERKYPHSLCHLFRDTAYERTNII